MSSIHLDRTTRRTTRRALRTSCQAVATSGFRLVGERILDASTDGLLVACDTGIALGEEVLVSFQTSGSSIWYDAEAEVTRILAGWRTDDPGYCAGLRFTHIERRDRLALGADLHDLAIAKTTRRLRRDFSRFVI
jgi:PilZ domain